MLDCKRRWTVGEPKIGKEPLGMIGNAVISL